MPQSRSIFINNHNNGPFLRPCIDSVLSQITAGDEVIVYDDGSTDDSREVLAAYGSAITCILATKNSAPYRQCQLDAVNASFRQSMGNYIYLLDGDDLFLPGKLEVYSRAFQDPAVTMVQGAMQRIDRAGNVTGEKRHRWAHGVDLLEDIKATNDLDYFYQTSALAFTRELLSAALPINLESSGILLGGTDIALSIHSVLLGKVVTLDELYTAWRQHNLNRSDRFGRFLHRFRFDLQMARYFNRCARAYGKNVRISPWRNTKLHRRTARHLLDLVSRRR